MSWKTLIFQLLFITVIFIVVYNLLKKYVLVKFHPNRTIVLIASVIAFFIPTIVGGALKRNMANSILQYICSAVFVVLFLWFLDLHNGVMYTKGSNKNIKIRPKAKPNRVHKNKK
ncbi:putative Ca2+/H+ antiporter (TMEM165/GDT1 family) [Clostridium algifaecis]|uniref:Ca2+/H+ antiporter (TMEM165/GDT1 family) n=1 Tax=Clostridium algifaecis TaxID=1472040 RepID=A0ABS4KQF0_9CLOT|nr:hypothetical protein [Clostridium algifaecis]MBP2032265.1 putative Ca2+/H+ antiporter (TMEM165/GDT1 family) [Clostridium algifaecis]